MWHEKHEWHQVNSSYTTVCASKIYLYNNNKRNQFKCYSMCVVLYLLFSSLCIYLFYFFIISLEMKRNRIVWSLLRIRLLLILLDLRMLVKCIIIAVELNDKNIKWNKINRSSQNACWAYAHRPIISPLYYPQQSNE